MAIAKSHILAQNHDQKKTTTTTTTTKNSLYRLAWLVDAESKTLI